jgi:hypothetical protein
MSKIEVETNLRAAYKLIQMSLNSVTDEHDREWLADILDEIAVFLDGGE